ncbi:ACT domain-containing family protein [Striga asiatica]|uniref:ACT domain-containing family protein n=1 Tax=Striga asiatica TaxID=4170 RepID=A0A5A7Q087_STRAF|nr:ACT domain-containing family protein [Striga asiatica]
MIDAKVWTSGPPIEDEQKLDTIGVILRNVLKADNDIRSARTSVSLAEIPTERRLHQLMFVDRDYKRRVVAGPCSGPSNSAIDLTRGSTLLGGMRKVTTISRSINLGDASGGPQSDDEPRRVRIAVSRRLGKGRER